MGEAEPLLELFRGERFDSPETVGLDLIYDPSLVVDEESGELPPQVAAVASSLAGAGFEVGEPQPVAAGPGLVIRHGANGSQAAAAVQTVFGPSFEWSTVAGGQQSAPTAIEQVDGLSGRNVVVAIGPAATVDIAASELAVAVPAEEEALEGESPPAEEPAPGEVEHLQGPTEMPADLVAGPDLDPSPRSCD
jgi:hypothetical protein